MPRAEIFEQIAQDQRAALVTALLSQAEHASVSLPAGLADRVGSAVPTGRPADEDCGTLRELFRGRPPLALVAFDTPGVHDYVFRVRRPVDIAGGSHLVAAFTDHERARQAKIRSVWQVLSQEGHPRGAMVFAGGGRGLAVVAAHRAASLRSAVEAVLADATRGDLETITAELSVWPEDLGPAAVGANDGSATSRYAAALSVLMGRLARERSRRERFGETVDAKTTRCSACRRRVATEERRKTGEWICAPCAGRRKLGGELKRHADEAKTFQDLVGADDPRLAVLYADGANVGAAFQDIDSMARHRALSEAVENAFDLAVVEILKRKELRDADDRQLCQIPIRGGDDAVLILPAPAAFKAATQLVRSVENAFDLQGNRLLRDALAGAPKVLRERVARFGVGVGIVFADCHFPVGFLVRYAEELLKSAKRLVHERGVAAAQTDRRVRSAVDYLVLVSGNPLSESIDRLRAVHFRVEPQGREPGLRLTDRPFSIEKLEEVLQNAEALRPVPASQRIAVRQEAFRGIALSRSLWRYQHARAKDGRGWAEYREALGVDLDHIDELLWRRAEPPPDSEGGDWRSTPYLDALEVLDLLPDERRGGAREARR